MAKNGDLYVSTLDTLIIISSDGNIKERINVPDISPPIAFSTGGDTIYFTTGGPMTSGRTGALNGADLNGNIYWSYNFAGNNWGIPLVDNNNKIYVFGTDSIYIGNYFLYCIKPNGELDWRYQVYGFLDYSAPTIDKYGNIIFNARKLINGEERNCIISLDYYGNENWVTPFTGDWQDHYINSGLVCDAEGKIYCGSSLGGYFYCFNNDGMLLWTYDLGDLEYDSCPAIGSDGTLYIGTHKSSLFQHHKNNLIAIKDTITSVTEIKKENLDYKLEQNYPNPFNPVTTISYSIKQSGLVQLRVYDLLGREVAELINEQKPSGNYSIEFDASNLSSGIYFYRINTENYQQTKKMILLR